MATMSWHLIISIVLTFQALEAARANPPDVAPVQPRHIADPVDVEITWLLDLLTPSQGQEKLGAAHLLHLASIDDGPVDGDRSKKAEELVAAVTYAPVEAVPARVNFSINRQAAKCHTPSNNQDVHAIRAGAAPLMQWMLGVERELFGAYRKGLIPQSKEFKFPPNLMPQRISDDVFNPVPAFLTLEAKPEGNLAADAPTPSNPSDVVVVPADAVAHQGGADAGQPGPIIVEAVADAEPSPARPLDQSDFEKLLQFQRSSLRAKFAELHSVMAPGGSEGAGVFTTVEGRLIAAIKASFHLWRSHRGALDSVEQLLRQQLINAIGSIVTAQDFAKYMEYHRRQLLKPAYCPQAFSYAVRRPGHYPEGVLSIENVSDAQPVQTTVLHKVEGHPVSFPLSAAVRVEMHGDHFVHARVLHQFSSHPTAGDAPAEVVPRSLDCAAGHGLVPCVSQSALVTRTCDICRSGCGQHDTMWSCRACDYDVCSSCAQARRARSVSKPAACTPESAPPSVLIARARQFSSFILVLGTMTAGDAMDPQHAIILQNKDVRCFAVLGQHTKIQRAPNLTF